MNDKYELVRKYNIDIDVYLNEDGVTPLKKLPDNKLTKELLRQYFLGKIDKVWKEWLHDSYWMKTKDGKTIYLNSETITAYDIEMICSNKRGGKRCGSGRKLKTGMNTKVMRVPSFLQEDIQCLIDMYAHWLHDEESQYTHLSTEEKRLEIINKITSILEYEKKCIMDKRRKMAEEEKNKDQLESFDNVTESNI